MIALNFQECFHKKTAKYGQEVEFMTKNVC